jgi:hypothetical protein
VPAAERHKLLGSDVPAMQDNNVDLDRFTFSTS